MNEERIATGGEAALAMTKTEELTPEQLGGEIRLLTSQARRMALSYAIQIGYRLKVAHEKVGPHGWADWLKAETEFSAAAASRFEKLYEGYGEAQGSLFGVGNNFPTLEKISVSNALRLLAVPEEEREQVARELDAEHLSTRELEKALAERDEARKALQEKEQELKEAWDSSAAAQDDLERVSQERVELLGKLEAAEKRAVEGAGPYKLKLAEAEKRVKELESRPVEVAVERDEEAIRKAAEEAKKAAEDAAKAELDKLRAKLQKAQADQRKAEEEKERAIRESPLQAEEAKAEAEKARAEADELRKKLRAAESGAGEVAMLARQAQVNFETAMEKIAAMRETHPDVAGKMLTGMERIAAALAERIREVRG